MEAKDYLKYIVHEIHTTIVATVDDEGLPVTAAIDMMDADENGLYFLTGIGPLIAGASPSLSIQYHALLSGAAIRLTVYAAVLLIGCITCLILCRRPHEAKAD